VDCPACGNDMTTMTAVRITVDACEGGCGGIWFNRSELMRVDETDESAGEGLLEIERDPNVLPLPKLNLSNKMGRLFAESDELSTTYCG
jgi:hypothetical protein